MINLGFMEWTWPNNSLGPGMYSWFHILWLIVMIILCVLAVFWAKKKNNPKVVDRTILFIDLFLLLTEICKQIMYQFSVYHYFRIDVLPFAFCSVPLYIALIGSLTKKEKLKNICYLFLSFYGIIGGLSAMIYPVSLMTYSIYISFQTMIWHVLLVVMAVYLIVAKGYGKSFTKEMIPSGMLFICLCMIAIGLNELAYHAYLLPRQTPVCTIDRNPGSYSYLKYGFEKDNEYYFLTDDNGKVSVSSSYKDSLDVYIAYPEGDDVSSKYLLVVEENDVTKYLEINSQKKAVFVNTPTSYWNWFYVESDRPVLSMDLDSKNYCLCLDDDHISIIDASSATPDDTLTDFISVSVKSAGDAANFFLISNHCLTQIPLLNLIQPKVAYPIFVIIYLISFFSASSIVWLVVFVIRKIYHFKIKVKEKI